MKIRIRTCKEEEVILESNAAMEVIPYQYVMVSPHVKKPYEGILYYKGHILPVTGPVPSVWEKSADYDNTPWILVCKDHARVILGLPYFEDAASAKINIKQEAQEKLEDALANEDDIEKALEEALASIA